MGKVLIVILGILIGIGIGYITFSNTQISSPIVENIVSALPHKKHVVGFMPYWLLDRVVDKDYSDTFTTLTYFGLTVSPDGTIVKLTNEQEEDPGWTTLKGNRLKRIMENAKKNNITFSLLVFNANEDEIGQLISNPLEHARNMTRDVIPLMKEYGFTDLNLDIESARIASEEARMNFTVFVKEVRKEMNKEKAGTISIDVSPTAFIKPFLVDPAAIKNSVDTFIIMAYDYHYQGGLVTGAVAPLYGASTSAEFDTDVAVRQILTVLPAYKVILGIPSYGYQWETIDKSPNSAIIPGSGITASNNRVETLLVECATCSATIDEFAKESFLVYRDEDTGTFYQIFFPTRDATQAKVEFAKQLHLGGIAVWALGYEGNTILEPLSEFK